MSRWEQDFDAYMVMIGERPASVLVDLAAATHAPVASHPLRVDILVPMLVPRDDGLRDRQESAALAALEDRVVATLESAVDAIFVGHVVVDGQTNLHLYVPAAHRAVVEDLPSLLGDPAPYRPRWLVEEDADWALYREFLAPGMVENQMIWNRRLVEQFQENGDRLDRPRTVDHMAFFPSRDAAIEAAARLLAAGYTTEEPSGPDEDGAWSLQFHREDALDGDRPDAFCAEILDVVLELEGTYDGWGAVLVK